MRTGSRLGIDVGTVRIGVARCDQHAMLATPVETVQRSRNDTTDIQRILALAAESAATEIIVGLPIALSGRETASTKDALDFAAALATAGNIPVRLVDERLSSTSAQAALHSSGRTVRSSRQVIDQVAATIILQQALDMERASGRPPGQSVPAAENPGQEGQA